MSLHKKRKVLRWSIRIILLMILLPMATLVTVRYAGWLRMRKTDREIKAFLGPYQVHVRFDTIKVSGRDIVVLHTSKGEAKSDAMIFVHGSPGSMDAFLDYMADTSLLRKADLVTYDRPGFGNSGFGRSEPSLSRQADMILGLMDSLAYQRYWLVGHSYGAPVLVLAAMRDPEKVAGMSLIAGSVSPGLEPKSSSWRKWIDLPLLRTILPISMRVSNEELMPLKQDLVMMEDDWDRLTMPVSIIHGTKDVLVPYENADYAADKSSNADTVITKIFAGESHFILWTHKQEVVGELLSLMDAGSITQ